MLKEELMIGDLVYRPDCYDTVKEIRENGIIGADSFRGIIGFKELEPIPLTSEILEKNGWVNQHFGTQRQEWWLDKTKFPIVRYSVNDTLHHNGIVLKFVHQLQHALKVCGIEKEIIL